MVRDDGKRNFALRANDGSEEAVFSGTIPRQAAVKAARRVADVGEDSESAPRTEIRLREKGTDKLHIYEAWAWKEEAPAGAPDWMPEVVTEANVSKQGIEHEDED